MIWVLVALCMAAVISPWVYQACKQLAATAEVADLPGAVEWLANECARAKFSLFFDRSLLLCAVVGLPFLMRRIRKLRVGAMSEETSRIKVSWKLAAVQILTGCVIAGGLLWALGEVLEAVGIYRAKINPPPLGKLLPKILITAVVASLLEEWLFRGVLLGLWLRFARPVAACIGISLLFAFLHFLTPPKGTVIADPSHPLAGFELLGKILLHFTNPMFFITDFATLLAIGLILAWARLRTGALWFSIGLHAGWILSFKAFNLLYRKVPDHFLSPWGVGDNLRSGLLPLVTLGLTAVVCHFALQRFAVNRASR